MLGNTNLVLYELAHMGKSKQPSGGVHQFRFLKIFILNLLFIINYLFYT